MQRVLDKWLQFVQIIYVIVTLALTMRNFAFALCSLIFLASFTSISSAAMNPNSRIEESNTSCSDADQTGPWEFSFFADEPIELSICFTNPSNDSEIFQFNYSITGQNTDSTEDDDESTPNGHILSTPVVNAEVAAGDTYEVTVQIQAQVQNCVTVEEELTVDFWAEENQSIPSESIVTSLSLMGSCSDVMESSRVPFVNPIMTMFVLIFAGVIYGRKLEF